ncbi:hypothetical protein SYNPS1DRAFT_30483 [Syncephalis pseudoplumigaleata]|uniref:Protein kinase domain-containing protein n=1 Tax=Syncephalis pseudoplumigaleata TaxID=1712513 RepID=A0A4P9YWR7_9FUNG|nr:hypothetical protein SYNPS1DRAFT_30483 [Syncephalis pseudoplumigaleata]|eukprot:RKP23761.1 hypothetical protein SYNPS1DRAFT_30483 [Syncephalis pseudoplumigaleata]
MRCSTSTLAVVGLLAVALAAVTVEAIPQDNKGLLGNILSDKPGGIHQPSPPPSPGSFHLAIPRGRYSHSNSMMHTAICVALVVGACCLLLLHPHQAAVMAMEDMQWQAENAHQASSFGREDERSGRISISDLVHPSDVNNQQEARSKAWKHLLKMEKKRQAKHRAAVLAGVKRISQIGHADRVTKMRTVDGHGTLPAQPASQPHPDQAIRMKIYVKADGTKTVRLINGDRALKERDASLAAGLDTILFSHVAYAQTKKGDFGCSLFSSPVRYKLIYMLRTRDISKSSVGGFPLILTKLIAGVALLEDQGIVHDNIVQTHVMVGIDQDASTANVKLIDFEKAYSYIDKDVAADTKVIGSLGNISKALAQRWSVRKLGTLVDLILHNKGDAKPAVLTLLHEIAAESPIFRRQCDILHELAETMMGPGAPTVAEITKQPLFIELRKSFGASISYPDHGRIASALPIAH